MKRYSIQLLLVVLFSIFLLSCLGSVVAGVAGVNVTILPYILFGLAVVSYGGLVAHGLLTRD